MIYLNVYSNYPNNEREIIEPIKFLGPIQDSKLCSEKMLYQHRYYGRIKGEITSQY